MKRAISLVVVASLVLVLTGCGRKVPPPASVTMDSTFTSSNQIGAAGDLVGMSLLMTVNKASGQLASLHDKHLLAKFSLGYRYKLYRVDQQLDTLISKGTYVYDLDRYHVNQSHLTMLSTTGLNLLLKFTTAKTGRFSATPNNAKIKNAQLSGTFSIKTS